MRYRDLTIEPFGDAGSLVIACDVSAGIGSKPADTVTVSPDVTAGFALRVPLMELFCFGAQPISVIDTIGNEMKPTGELMIAGLTRELKRAGLSAAMLNGSTEDNMPTTTTSIGVTVVGKTTRSLADLNYHQPMSVYRLGEPLVGDAVKRHFIDLFSYDVIQKLRADSAVIDMLPVGSKGIAFEIGQLAATHHLTIKNQELLNSAFMTQSAGPATVVLIGVDPINRQSFEHRFPQVTYLLDLN